MKKLFGIFLLIIIPLIIGFFIYNYNLNKHNNSSYTTEKSSYTTNENNLPEIKEPKIIEQEISSFSTKIHNKDEDRQNNIGISISSLNDTIVNPGDTFSFCDTIGKATSDKGYEKADVYSGGKLIQALGGGNCQVSTTLYNAVLNIPELEIIERHEHSGYVPYIKDGKDAAVSYGTHDFKFKNNLNESIKIKAENTENEVIIKIIELKEETQ